MPPATCFDARQWPGPRSSRAARPSRAAAEGQPQGEAAVGDEAVGDPPPGPQLTGRGPEHLLAGPIELADAAEAGREGDVGDRQIRVVEQSAGEMGPAGAGELVRSHPEHVRRTDAGGDGPIPRAGRRARPRCCRRARRRGSAARPGTRAPGPPSDRRVGAGRAGTAGRPGTRPPRPQPPACRRRTFPGCGRAAAAGPAVDACRDDCRKSTHDASDIPSQPAGDRADPDRPAGPVRIRPDRGARSTMMGS